jgi:hypothetical protein
VDACEFIGSSFSVSGMKVFALDLFLQISRVFIVSLEAEVFGICLSLIVDTLMMMHVEFNRIFFLVASEHAGLHGRSLVPVSHVSFFLLVGTSVYKTLELPSLIWMHVELLWDFFSFSEHAGLHR